MGYWLTSKQSNNGYKDAFMFGLKSTLRAPLTVADMLGKGLGGLYEYSVKRPQSALAAYYQTIIKQNAVNLNQFGMSTLAISGEWSGRSKEGGGPFMDTGEQTREQVQAILHGYQNPDEYQQSVVSEHIKKRLLTNDISDRPTDLLGSVGNMVQLFPMSLGDTLAKWVVTGKLPDLDFKETGAQLAKSFIETGIDLATFPIDRPLDYAMFAGIFKALGYTATTARGAFIKNNLQAQRTILAKAIKEARANKTLDPKSLKAALADIKGQAGSALAGGGENYSNKVLQKEFKGLVEAIRKGDITWDQEGIIPKISGGWKNTGKGRYSYDKYLLKELQKPTSKLWQTVDNILNSPMIETLNREYKPTDITKPWFAAQAKIEPLYYVALKGEKSWGTYSKIVSPLSKAQKKVEFLKSQFGARYENIWKPIIKDQASVTRTFLATEGLIPMSNLSPVEQSVALKASAYYAKFIKPFGIKNPLKFYMPHVWTDKMARTIAKDALKGTWDLRRIARVLEEQGLSRRAALERAQVIIKSPNAIKVVKNGHLLRRLGAKGYTLDPIAANDHYLNLMLRKHILEPELKKVAPVIDNLPQPLREAFTEYESSLIGASAGSGGLTKLELAKMLEHLPGVNKQMAKEAANEAGNLLRDIVYSSGLGTIKAPAKNIIQGLTHGPAKLGLGYKAVGLQQITTKAGRDILQRDGVWKAAAPFMEETGGKGAIGALRKGLKATTIPFQFVDKFPNRGADYLGARQMFLDTYKFEGLKGIERLLKGAPRGVRVSVFKQISTTGQKPAGKAIIEGAKEFAKNLTWGSQYPYGEMLGPSIYSGSGLGKTAGIFGTWSLYYQGFLKYMTPKEALRYTTSATILYLAAKRAHMDISRALWLGATPTSVGGPILGAGMKAASGTSKMIAGAWTDNDYLMKLGMDDYEQLIQSSVIFIPVGLMVKETLKQFNILLDDLTIRSRSGKAQGQLTEEEWLANWAFPTTGIKRIYEEKKNKKSSKTKKYWK